MKAKTPRYSLGLAVLLALLGAPAVLAQTSTIKKCQDATGRWHYGDSAAEECARSKITVLSEHGVTKKEIAAPLTAEQLKQREQDGEAAARAKEQAKQDELLLATYGSESDILYIRDRKLAQIESAIRASTDTLTPLRATLSRLEAQAAAEQKAGGVSEQTIKALEQTRQQIARHENTIAQKRQEQEQIRARAEQDLARYRQLKSQPIKTAAPPAR